jgi:hypothetical protein
VIVQPVVKFLRDPRGAWLVLGVAMLASAGLILHAADGQGFAIDELFYYGRVAEKGDALVHFSPFSVEYLLAPFNGHLPLGGRFVYEAVFATVGAKYHAFVLINIAALFACVALTFELARRRVGTIAALAPCLVLLFLGFAREQLLWALDFNTAASLAAGLGAILALQRGDRRGDILACILLAVSIAMIELGLSFALGIAIWLLVDDRRRARRRAWIVLAPIVLYAAWWVWARKFDQSQATASNIHLIPETLLNAGASVLGSLTGTNPVVAGSYTVEVTWFGRALAIVAAVALVVRLVRGSLPRTIWIWLAVLGSYWLLLAVAARPAQGSRYILVGAVLLVLIGADAMRGAISNRLAAALLVLAAVAIPANVDQLLDGRQTDTLHHDPPISSAEFAALELARAHVDPDFVASEDPRVAEAGGGLYIGLPAGAYLDGASQNGSIAFSLGELRRGPEELRAIADATLVGALGIATEYALPSQARQGCHPVNVDAASGLATFTVDPGVTVIRSGGPGWAELRLRRFAAAGPGATLGKLPPERWVSFTVPSDRAPDPWAATIDAAATVCRGQRTG